MPVLVFGDERRTEISYEEGEINMEDFIADENVAITISHAGYIKRTAVSEYRTQSRGGRGARGSKTKDEDFIEHMFVASNHNYLLFFTELGKCYWLRVYEIPGASKTSGGRFIQNILSIPPDDKVKAYTIVQDLTDKEFLDDHYILFCTKKGLVKKTSLEAYSRPREGGIIAIAINEDDQLLEARLTNGNNEIFLASKEGNAIRFNEANVRPMGRTATGVRGLMLDSEEDITVGMACVEPGDSSKTILTISEKGSGKRTEVTDYRLTNRGGKGVKTMEVTDKTGAVIAIKAVAEDDDLMITTRFSIVIRMAVSDIRVMGRATQGVRVIRLDGDDEIADVTVVPKEEEPEVEPTEAVPADSNGTESIDATPVQDDEKPQNETASEEDTEA